MSITLYWGAERGCELHNLISYLDKGVSKDELVYTAVDYPLGARALNDDFFPVLQEGWPSESQWDKASEMRLFWENACLLAIKKDNGLWSFSLMSEQADFFKIEHLDMYPEEVRKEEKQKKVYLISDWSRFVPKPENMPKSFKLIEYGSHLFSERPWRIWLED